MYTLRQFRANTKQAFDDSAEGHEVTISRGKQLFQLVSLVDKPLPGHSFESVPAKPVIKKKADPPGVFRETGDFKLCKHSASPQFCKFAKPGKPCK